MTPHELINLPYAGMAEKELRKAGMWRKDPSEYIEDALGDLEVAIDMAKNAQYAIEKQWMIIK